MILLEHEPPLPVAVERQKVEILEVLKKGHAFYEFYGITELRHWLDDLTRRMEKFEAHGLTRVLLFARTDRALVEVGLRMASDSIYFPFHAPSCWQHLGRHLPQMRAMAARIEGGE